MPKDLSVSTTPIIQPNRLNTKKAQKRGLQPDEYSPQSINSELDLIHERINEIIVEDPALTLLAGTATLAEVITRLNSITATMQKAGLLAQA